MKHISKKGQAVNLRVNAGTSVKKRIPRELGNRINGAKVYIAAILLDALIHVVMLAVFGCSVKMIIKRLVSFLFFIYPICATSDAIWSLRPCVNRILTGEVRINRKYYMNTPKEVISTEDLPSVTVSIPVYLEENSVIFDTVRSAVKEANNYASCTGRPAGVIVSDDGLASLFGGSCSREQIDSLLNEYAIYPELLNEKERKAAERICFYRKMQIGFVARPAAGRAGLFKKASNLNCTLRLGAALSEGLRPEQLEENGGIPKDLYFEGPVITGDIILLLDKDSGMKTGIIEAIVPEFTADSQLAYVQCATDAINMHENYFAYAMGHFNNRLFHTIWPCKALQGFFVPLVGHNAFLRRSALEQTGYWSEDKVSEDYDKAIDLYNNGWHGKYAQIPGLEFTEYVSRTFNEETGKQYRYSYGLFEMMFGGTVVIGKTRPCDVLFMLVYFASLMNEVLLIPSVLFAYYFSSMKTLWGGFLVCTVAFALLPSLRGEFLRRDISEDRKDNLLHSFIISLSFLGHSFSKLSGAIRYVSDRFRENRKSFPSTSVDTLSYTFKEGIMNMESFLGKNRYYIPLAGISLGRVVLIMIDPSLVLPAFIPYSIIMFGIVLVPFIMTPQLFPTAGMFGEEARELTAEEESSPENIYEDVNENVYIPVEFEGISLDNCVGY